MKIGYIRVSESAVIANFTAAPTEGDAPLAVHFTDQSVGDITSWQWDFGDRDTLTGTAQLPVHIYEAVGVYTVSLRVSGPGGSNLLVRRGYITMTGGQRVYLPLVIRSSTGQTVGGAHFTRSRSLKR